MAIFIIFRGFVLHYKIVIDNKTLLSTKMISNSRSTNKFYLANIGSRLSLLNDKLIDAVLTESAKNEIIELEMINYEKTQVGVDEAIEKIDKHFR